MCMLGPQSLPSRRPPWLAMQNIPSAWLWATFPALCRTSPEHRSCPGTGDLQPRRQDSWRPGAVAPVTGPCVPHRDSCQRGWRLLHIVTAYHSCSEVLRPHLLHFLQDVGQTPGLPFQGEGPAASGAQGRGPVYMGAGWAASWRGNPEGLAPHRCPGDVYRD